MTEETPLVSVVVPMYNCEAFLASSLKRLKKQTYSNVEFILVDDGSCDGTKDVALAFAGDDARFRVLSKENGGPSAARNYGIAAARGDYYFFLDSDDWMDSNTLEVMVDYALRDEVDIVAVGYDLIKGKKHKLPALWIQKLFSEEKRAFSLCDYPDILAKSTPWGLLFESSFFRSAELSFKEGVLYEDQIFLSEAYAKAKKGISIVPALKCHWVQRDGSITHTYDESDIESRLDAVDYTLHNLKEFSSEVVAKARLVQCLNRDLLTVIRRSRMVFGGLSKGLRDRLLGFYAQLEDKRELDDCAYVAWRLFEEGNDGALSRYLEETNASSRKVKFVNRDGKPFVDWSTFAYLGEIVSNGTIAPETFMPHASLAGLEYSKGVLRLSVHAFVTKVSPDQFDYKVGMELVEFREGSPAGKAADSIPCKLVGRHSQTVSIRENHEWWADYSGNFFDFEVPDFWSKWNACYKLMVTIEVAGMSFALAIPTTRSEVSPTLLVSKLGQLKVKTDKRISDFIYLKYTPAATVSVEKVAKAHATIRIESGSPLQEANFEGIDDVGSITPRLHDKGNMHYEAMLNLSKSIVFGRLFGKSLRLISPAVLRLKNKKGNRIDAYLDRDEVLFDSSEGFALLQTPDRGLCAFSSPYILIREFKYEDGVFGARLELFSNAKDTNNLVVRFVSGAISADFEVEVESGQETWLSFDLKQAPPFGAPLDPGTYKIRFALESGGSLETVYENGLFESFPLDVYDQDSIHVCRIKCDKKRKNASIQINRYMPDSAKGGFGYGSLMAAYKNSTEPVDKSKVLMRTYYGESVTDNALALSYAILRSGRKDLELYWATQGLYTPIPEGTKRVIVNSPDWFRLLATAGTVIENVHQVNYMDKKPGQRIVQCFHGYPFKGMGKVYYLEHGYTADRLDSFQRREADWDFILSPAPYASPLYAENFNFHGEFLEIGHPRNDVLIRDEAAEYRKKINKSLRLMFGANEGQKLILFAPTYRDYAAINEFKTERIDFVDPGRLAERLGDDYMILLRGHAMNKRAGSSVESHRNVVDVTRYPEINHLVIASDMAILDYSSLRFDYAQSGKPMIFFAPDLKDYFGDRPPLVPYEETAPGPICSNEDELVAALMDSDGYAQKYGEKLRKFKERYTPLEDGHASERFMDALFGDPSKG